MLQVYSAGTEVKLKNYGAMVAFVDKAIIGEGNVVQYNLITYNPERNQLLVNASEIQSAGDRKKKHAIGFHVVEPKKRVQIFVDKNNKLVDFDTESDIVVNVVEIEEVQNEEEK